MKNFLKITAMIVLVFAAIFVALFAEAYMLQSSGIEWRPAPDYIRAIGYIHYFEGAFISMIILYFSPKDNK